MSTTANAPINVQQHPVLGPSVSGRAVYSCITISRASRDIFSDWFRDKQSKLSMVEGKDFVTTSTHVEGTNRKHIEHIVTIEAAKRMAEIATANRGLELAAYLKYYPSVESQQMNAKEVSEANQPQAAPMPPISLFNNLASSAHGKDQGAPLPESPVTEVPSTPLSPVQQLLAEVQKLADQEASRKNEPEVQSEQLKGLEVRLNRLENNTNIILYFFQQASTALRSLAPAQLPYDAELVSAPLPDLEPTKRAKVNRLVDGYAAAKTVTHQEVWKHLYGHLSSRFGFDAWTHAQSKKNPNYLEIVEENGQLSRKMDN